MGLFDKKYCSICNNKIGLLGNRKLEDGNLCKECAAKLSPWFSERRHSTVQEIGEQLNYRENNKSAVQAFRTTRDLGRYTRVLIDDGAQKFMITSAKDLASANPDVLDFDQVTGCMLDVDESRNELKQKDSSGKSVSYVPPRYEYSYNFYITVRVNHPYFDEMRFRVNTSSVETGERSMAGMTDPNYRINPAAASRATNAAQYYEYLSLCNEIKAAFDGMIQASVAGVQPAQPEDVQDPELKKLLEEKARVEELTKDPEKLRAYYENALKEAQAAAGIAGSAGIAGAAASMAPATVKCQWCGCQTPADKGSCQFCGGPLN